MLPAHRYITNLLINFNLQTMHFRLFKRRLKMRVLCKEKRGTQSIRLTRFDKYLNESEIRIITT